MAEGSGKVQHIVADSAAFLRNAPLHDMCENVYTIEDVINEIRDVTTRQRLAVLPYNIQFREPSTEALHAGKFTQLNCSFFKTKSSRYMTVTTDTAVNLVNCRGGTVTICVNWPECVYILYTSFKSEISPFHPDVRTNRTKSNVRLIELNRT